MLHRHATGPLSQRRFFLLEVNDMSNHMISFESNRIGATPEGWTAKEIRNGRSKEMKRHRQSRRCLSNPVGLLTRCC